MQIKDKNNNVILEISGNSLRYADLRDTDLQGADLRDADLQYADLRDADLRYADLRYANLPKSIRIYQAGLYTAYIMADATRIGCKYHSSNDWLAWSPEDVADMAPDAKEWWTEHGPTIKSIIKQLQDV